MKTYKFTVKETGDVNNPTEHEIVFQLERLASEGAIPEFNDVEDFTQDRYETLDLLDWDKVVAKVTVEWVQDYAKVTVNF